VYHLDKLTELGLAEKTNGEYHLVKAVNVGVLKQFVRFGALMLPRHLLYATMFTTLLIFLGLLATGIMWYETLKAWRQKP